MKRGVAAVLGAWLVVAIGGCGIDTAGRATRDGGGAMGDGGSDTGARDAGRDAPIVPDSGPDEDAGLDGGPEIDAGSDSGTDAGELDAGMDAGVDAGEVDAGADGGGLDAGSDAAPMDAGADAGASDAGPDSGSTPCVMVGDYCDGNFLRECMSGSEVSTFCPLGCTVSGGSGRCRHVDPTHITDRTLIIAGTFDATVAAGETWTFRTDTGAITDGSGTVIRPAGAGTMGGIRYSTEAQGGMLPVLGIFSFRSITVEAGGTILATGPHALVLLSAQAVRVDGTIDLSASGRTAGSGGGTGGARRGAGMGLGGGGAGEAPPGGSSGGGGGGHAGAGGDGGDGGGGATGGGGGTVVADPDGSPLVGGGGGGGGADATAGGFGGGGGGALQITSDVSITVGAGAVIRVNGAGGRNALAASAGGGGGAGGTIFLEAPAIDTRGILVANGGGGAGGDTSVPSDAEPGATGRDDTMAAQGSAGVGVASGDGGDGAAGAVIDGQDAPDVAGVGGGGGGAAGRLRFVTMGSTLVLMGTTSPTDSGARTMDTSLTTW